MVSWDDASRDRTEEKNLQSMLFSLPEKDTAIQMYVKSPSDWLVI